MQAFRFCKAPGQAGGGASGVSAASSEGGLAPACAGAAQAAPAAPLVKAESEPSCHTPLVPALSSKRAASAAALVDAPGVSEGAADRPSPKRVRRKGQRPCHNLVFLFVCVARLLC